MDSRWQQPSPSREQGRVVVGGATGDSCPGKVPGARGAVSSNTHAPGVQIHHVGRDGSANAPPGVPMGSRNPLGGIPSIPAHPQHQSSHAVLHNGNILPSNVTSANARASLAQLRGSPSHSNSVVSTPEDGRMPVHNPMFGGYFDVPVRVAPGQLAPPQQQVQQQAQQQQQPHQQQKQQNGLDTMASMPGAMPRLSGAIASSSDTPVSVSTATRTPLGTHSTTPESVAVAAPVTAPVAVDFMDFREGGDAFGPFVGSEPMDPVLQLEQELQLDQRLLDSIQPVSDEEDALTRRRARYKPKSSIPPDLSSAKYASQCLSAAVSARLPPYRLHPGEYTQLRPHLGHQHVTTYLNIRNGILRLWLANPTVNVTRVEAAGCVRNERFYSLAEFAFEWLVRNGYINHGCVEPSPADPMHRPLHAPTARRKPRQTIVVIGAGISGLSCARQLHGLFQRYRYAFSAEYEDVPRVVLLEARRRIGGRVCTAGLDRAKSKLNAHLSPINPSPAPTSEDMATSVAAASASGSRASSTAPSGSSATTSGNGTESADQSASGAGNGGGGGGSGTNLAVDLGADTVLGFGGGNPLATVLRRQLGLPVVPVDASSELHDARTGETIDAERTFRAHELFGHMLSRLAEFESGMPDQITAMGSKPLMRSARDPPSTDNAEEARTIAKMEELERPYKDPGAESGAALDGRAEAAIESKLLKELGYTVAVDAPEEIQVQALPLGGASSLGASLAGFTSQLETLAQFDDVDRQALDWYLAKFEGLAGAEACKLGLNAFSHHRRNRFSGRHAWVRGGFALLAKGLATTPIALDVRFKTLVTLVEYEHDHAMVTLNNGEQMAADRVVCTLPLGVLKRRSMQFIPDLPHWKLDSIERLEVGTLNKIVLLFDRVFWDEHSVWNVANESSAQTRGECYMLANHAPETGHPLIVGLCSGSAANSMTKDRDAALVNGAVMRMRALFPIPEGEPEPRLVESVVTHWQLDPLSQGSHSYVGVNGTVVDHDLLSRPVNQSLFFAGEATSRNYPGTVHGAYLSGLRAARDVVNSLLGAVEIPEPLIAPLGSDSLTQSSVNTPQQAGVRSHATQAVQQQVQQQAQSHAQAHAQAQAHAHARAHAHPHGHLMGYAPSFYGSNAGPGPGAEYNSRYMASLAHRRTPLDISELETELANLRHDRLAEENAQMEQDLVLELGERPVRPERGPNTNPFLLFQKDYWEICRRETEDQKLRDRRGGKASRNEIRATLGKRWKTLPEDEKAPYMQRTQRIKEDNEQKTDEYIRKTRWYDAEADNFRQQWKLDHPSVPSEREQELTGLIEEFAPKKKRARVLE